MNDGIRPFLFTFVRNMLQSLQNMGNTCSINTLIQCIGHSRLLREWFLSDQPHQILNQVEGKHHLSVELARIIHEMWVENKSLAPVRFLKVLYGCLNGMISRGEQLDLSELWMLLVDKINNEIGNKNECPHIEGNTRDLEAFQNAWKQYNSNCMSSFLMMIQGWTLTQVQCMKCSHGNKKFEPFCSFGLDVHECNGNFEQMFANCFKKEIITERNCEECKTCCEAMKGTNICMYPNVLVIYIKRFEVQSDGRMKKLMDAVDIPLHMKFQGLDKPYHLVSIGNHIGNLDGGHYYAICKNPDGNWFQYDDISITAIEDISTVITKNRDGYLLVYEF